MVSNAASGRLRRYNEIMSGLGKMLMTVGGLLFLLGALVMLGGRSQLPIGRLPGDIVYRGKHTTFYFPIITCIVLSLVLTFVLWLLGRIGR